MSINLEFLKSLKKKKKTSSKKIMPSSQSSVKMAHEKMTERGERIINQKILGRS